MSFTAYDAPYGASIMIYVQYPQFNNRLRALRETLNLGQKEMADKIGVSIRYYQKLEKGDHEPSLDVFMKTLNGLNLTYEGFWGLKPIPQELPESVRKLSDIIVSLEQENANLKTKMNELNRLTEKYQQVPEFIFDLLFGTPRKRRIFQDVLTGVSASDVDARFISDTIKLFLTRRNFKGSGKGSSSGN